MPEPRIEFEQDIVRRQYHIVFDVPRFQWNLLIPYEVLEDRRGSSESVAGLVSAAQRELAQRLEACVERFASDFRRTVAGGREGVRRNVDIRVDMSGNAPPEADSATLSRLRGMVREAMPDLPRAGRLSGGRPVSPNSSRPQTAPVRPAPQPEPRRLDVDFDIDRYEAEANAAVAASQSARRRLEDME